MHKTKQNLDEIKTQGKYDSPQEIHAMRKFI